MSVFVLKKQKQKNLLLCKRFCEDEKISYRLGESICKPHIHIKNSKISTVKKQRIQLQNGQKDTIGHFTQRGYTDGK